MSANADLMLVIGLVLLVFAIPSIVSAFSDRRAPRVPTIVLMIGGVMVVWAIRSKPGGYTMEQLPEVFIGVVKSFL